MEENEWKQPFPPERKTNVWAKTTGKVEFFSLEMNHLTTTSIPELVASVFTSINDFLKSDSLFLKLSIMFLC
ncbi:hypothetical protein L596_006844 [Steinernema carpocapsae]|uniref:Uncharacterized protein n=1 Tax=Steinernema carpocapsae TaxID=34508 RepID=A0A4U5P740_STECR|nr:hypothetical protein L596_006844 [Steinernema carpocapsae]